MPPPITKLKNLAVAKLTFLKGEAKQQVGGGMLKARGEEHAEEHKMPGARRNKPSRP